MAIGEEVSFIAQQLSQVGEAQSEFDPSERLTYLSPELCATPKSRVQGLAVEGMLAADRFLHLSFEGCAIESLKHLSAAYKCIIECVGQSQELLHPRAIRDGAGGLDRISNDRALLRRRVQ